MMLCNSAYSQRLDVADDVDDDVDYDDDGSNGR